MLYLGKVGGYEKERETASTLKDLTMNMGSELPDKASEIHAVVCSLQSAAVGV